MNSLLASMALLCSLTCIADDHSASYLKLAGSLNDTSLLTTKLATLGHQGPLLGVFDYQLEAGVLQRPGSFSVFAGPSLGLSIVNQGYYVKFFSGPLVISPTDERLGTNVEINSDLELGLRDDRGVGIGFGYKHISNAGTGGVNLGRDFLFFKISIP